MSGFRTLGSLLLGTTALFNAEVVMAQTTAPVTEAPADENIIVVTGSQIRGAQVNDILPVTVLDEDQIEAVGAASGEELFRAIPQNGTVAFNEQNTTGGVNGARGDIASINLRDLGTGNTLMLINGRRMNLHPGFQTELLVPVVSPDTNEIAPGSVRRIEVLRDGASAVYGADAVAGVINTILKSNLRGGFVEADYRISDGTDLYNTSISGGYGFDFAEGRGNLTLYGGYYHENGAPVTIRDYAAFDDRRPLVVGTAFEDDASFNNRSTSSPFGQFDIQAPTNRTPLLDDDFYLQPSTFDGCRLDFGNGLCGRNGTTPSTDIRYNSNFGTDLFSRKNRYNAAALFNYDISDSVEFYIESSYYRSESRRSNEASALLSAVPVGISRNAFYNPFGPTLRADGSVNTNRLSGTTIAATGADVIMERMRFIDVGNRDVEVTKDSYRFVTGLKGNLGEWDFDTGFVYSQANSIDLTRGRISLTKLQDSMNRTDASAYNPFNGGCLAGQETGPNNGDCTPNPQATIDDITIDVFRKGETTLALLDFKVSRDDIFTLPGGNVGIATGIEYRRETFKDDRDDRLDGTITYTDSVTGVFNGSDVVGSSPSPDTSGSRDVFSAFAEVFVPLVSEDMEIPLIRELTVQLAGRAEHFKDIDETTVVPRAAVAWTLFDGLLLRGAWSRGFRAPNLVQVNDEGTTRSNTRDDFVICQAQVEKMLIANLGACSGSGTISLRTGTDSLVPETNTSINLGVVIEPPFIPGLTLTADYWNIKQKGLVGVFGDDNAIALDLLRRLDGSTNPNVIRADPDAGQIALFAGTSLTPAGSIIQVLDPYFNLDSRESSGWDFGMYYDLPEFGLGDFRLRFNAARLRSFVQSAGPEGQELLDAISAGRLPTDVGVGGLGELIEVEGRPRWRFSSSILWSSGDWNASLFGQYVGRVYDTSVTRDVLLFSENPNFNFYEVNDLFTMNASVSYTINNDTALNGTRLKLGVNNVFNTAPPLADESYGFFSELHSARQRVFHVELRKKF